MGGVGPKNVVSMVVSGLHSILTHGRETVSQRGLKSVIG